MKLIKYFTLEQLTPYLTNNQKALLTKDSPQNKAFPIKSETQLSDNKGVTVVVSVPKLVYVNLIAIPTLELVADELRTKAKF